MRRLGGEQDFKKKREQFSLNVRKSNRQSLLMKRRNVEDSGTRQEEEQSAEKLIIVDQCIQSYLEEMLREKYGVDQLKELVHLMDSSDILEKHRAIIGIRQLSTRLDEQMVGYLLEEQIIDKLVEWYSQESYPQIKLESLWIFTNLSSFSRDVSDRLVAKQILPLLASDLLNECGPIQYQAIWAVGNIAADDPKYRDHLISLGAVAKILRYLEEKRTSSQIVTAVWALSNLARGQPPPKYDSVKHVVPCIAEALRSGVIRSEQVLSDCLWTLANLSDGPKVRLVRIRQTEALPKILTYLHHPTLSLCIPALRIVGNFTSGSKEDTNEILKLKFLDEALILLDHPKAIIVKQTCWALSNITAGTDEQILQFLQRQDIVEKLLTTYHHQTPDIRAEVIWVFSNLERCDLPDLILDLFQTIKLVAMIGEQLKQKDEKCLVDALTCLYRVFALAQKCNSDPSQPNRLTSQFVQLGYAPVLQGLQKHDSDKICRECHKIMQRFFDIYQSQSMQDV